MPHIALLGDSILDNRAYVPRGMAVIDQLHASLAGEGEATLLAVDGSRTANLDRQLERLPDGVSHLVVAVGGNDALAAVGILDEPCRTVGDGLGRLATVRERFHEAYSALLRKLATGGLPLACCTIYDPDFAEPERQRLAVAGLTLFNDVITREAFRHGAALLDLRLICSEPGDLANPIEPSAQGGRKIARAILAFAQAPRVGGGASAVFAAPA